MLRQVLVVVTAAALAGCGGAAPETDAGADRRVRALADSYVDAYFDRFPEQATYLGVAGRSHDRLTDNSLAALAAWDAREDAWLDEVRGIDAGAIASAPLRATHAILREALESSAASRICRSELWNVSPMTGWHVGYGYLVTIQPTGNDQARREALARWAALPTRIDSEIANPREGLKRGYPAPRHIVRIVAGQVRTLASAPAAGSPFLAPVRAAASPDFARSFTAAVNEQILPAVRRYADFLEREYLPAAREATAVSVHPDGAACYDASIRAFSTLPKSAREVHDIGLREVARIDAAMKTIAERSFGTSDVPALMQRLRTDPKFLFRTRQELIAYSQAALERARAAAP